MVIFIPVLSQVELRINYCSSVPVDNMQHTKPLHSTLEYKRISGKIKKNTTRNRIPRKSSSRSICSIFQVTIFSTPHLCLQLLFFSRFEIVPPGLFEFPIFRGSDPGVSISIPMFRFRSCRNKVVFWQMTHRKLITIQSSSHCPISIPQNIPVHAAETEEPHHLNVRVVGIKISLSVSFVAPFSASNRPQEKKA